MTCRYQSKKDLYRSIWDIRDLLGIPPSKFPIDAVALCDEAKDIDLEYSKFDDYRARAFCIHANTDIGGIVSGENNLIILNIGRNPAEQNFDCAHELIHALLHVGEKKVFYCIEDAKSGQDPVLEWQANEGAAELLIPYSSFINNIKMNISAMYTVQDFARFKRAMAKYYNVTNSVIEIRLNSLAYEIDQHVFSNVFIPLVEILSLNEREKNGLNININARIEYAIKTKRFYHDYKSMDELLAECKTQIHPIPFY